VSHKSGGSRGKPKAFLPIRKAPPNPPDNSGRYYKVSQGEIWTRASRIYAHSLEEAKKIYAANFENDERVYTEEPEYLSDIDDDQVWFDSEGNTLDA
jgi:hypothetical protein